MSFNKRTAAAQSRASRRFSRDEQGQPLSLWWPETTPTSTPSLRISNGVTRGTANGKSTKLSGLAVLENDDVVFCAPVSSFPDTVPPDEGVIFYSGHSITNREKWRCSGSRVAGGLVEIDCRRT